MGDIEKAKREMRWAKSSADDRRWDQLEPKIQTIEEALQGVPEAEAAPILAELRPLKEKLAAGIREEKAGRIEREIQRNLSAAADDLNRGYKESPQLPKAIDRLNSAEAKEVLSADQVAKLQAEIAGLQAKSGGAPSPPPPPPKPAAADAEKARLIEGDVSRTLKYAADEIARNPSGGESYISRVTTKLDSDDTKQNLAPETMQRLRKELADLKAKVDHALRAEKAAGIEREIRRSISAAADELGRGYKESPQLTKAVERLNSTEARSVLPDDVAAKLLAEMAPLLAKTNAPAPLSPTPPKPAAASAPQAAPPPAPSKPAAAAPVENERARAIEGDLNRTMRFALDELERNPLQVDNYVAKLNAKLEADETKANLPAETLAKLRAQVDDLQAKSEAAKQADRRRVLEDFVNRFIRNGEEYISHNRRGAHDMLRNASERLIRDDAKQLFTPERIAQFKAEIDRVQKLVTAADRKDALDRAQPLLQELEERVAKPIFDDSAPAWRILGDLDSLKTRIRSQISDLAKDDVEVKSIEARVAKVDAAISKATAKLGRDQAQERVRQLWEVEQKAIEGWEAETGGDAKAPTYEMPRSATTVRRLTWFLNDGDIKNIAAEYKDDQAIQSVIADAKKIRESAIQKMHGAFGALMGFLEKQPRPSNRIDLEQPFRLSGTASGDFDGTPHKDANVGRAKALGERWEKEIEAERKAKQAKYDELSAVAAKAWPRIKASIKAEDGFDPLDAGSKGKVVLLTGIRNRIGWDFSGPFHFAMWVSETPVVGDYDKTVLAEVNAMCEKVGLGLDDHTDWDVVLQIGGPGKIKQRFQVSVRDRSNLEIGRIEEWRPVDCVKCTVIAMRAGPVAVGPKS